MSSRPTHPRSILLLGAGQLGREVAVSAQRLGIHVIAADEYPDAPAMAVSQRSEVFSLEDAVALEGVIRTHDPDLILPDVGRVTPGILRAIESEGFVVVPNADAAELVGTRDAVRALAAELGLRTPRHASARSEEELQEVCDGLGYPCLVKPVGAPAGKGQTVVPGPSRIGQAWDYAREGSGGDPLEVLVEEEIDFRVEITLPTVRAWDGRVSFAEPIAYRRERGEYREAWVPAEVSDTERDEMRSMSRAMVDRLGGAGMFGVGFFLTPEEVILSGLSPGPPETGMVTIVSQDLSQFDLHVRAVLGLPVSHPTTVGPTAAAVILADRSGVVAGYGGLSRALQVETAQVYLSGHSEAQPHRRMGAAFARGADGAEARARALEAASRVTVRYA